ncbi:MAG TPA: uracil-DNA glycosylase [Planctomycetota bacterium]|nr:uracil-DNA glycosylase [Planctomycetota bacterium]
MEEQPTPPRGGPKAPQDLPPSDSAELRREVLACGRCGLSETAAQAVLGTGTVGAPLMFVGEAPGREEDRVGEPFVGRAGQLLNRALEKLGVARSQVYITNVVKYRPPENRLPRAAEIRACMTHLRREIALVRPKVICALGTVAAQALLDTKESLARLRGRHVEVHGVRVLPTFHPAYILRSMEYSRAALQAFEADLRRACRDAGLLGDLEARGGAL